MRCFHLVLLLLLSALCTFAQAQTDPDALLIPPQINHYADLIFANSTATGMALVVIDGDQQFFTSRGETQPGSGVVPQKNSLIRIASLSKLMTSEIMLKLAEKGRLQLDDPLSKYAPPGRFVPTYMDQSIRLIDLATHTSGLPREQPGGKQGRPVFIWPTHQQRWKWISQATLTVPRGTQAVYSNLGYDLLADALSQASGQSYPTLLRQLITRPLQMTDTTFTPSAEQCHRLMVAKKSASPCLSTLASIGSGGIYSTPEDMGRWMRQFLDSRLYPRQPEAKKLQTMIYRRAQLAQVTGMDVPGKADAIGMGWVYMASQNGWPAIIQKTGGGGGFMTYMAMVPQQNVAVFVVATQSPGSHFTAMTEGANDLLTALTVPQAAPALKMILVQ